jgi:hypothetical protein
MTSCIYYQLSYSRNKESCMLGRIQYLCIKIVPLTILKTDPLHLPCTPVKRDAPMRAYGGKLRQWPNLHMNFSTPTCTTRLSCISNVVKLYTLLLLIFMLTVAKLRTPLVWSCVPQMWGCLPLHANDNNLFKGVAISWIPIICYVVYPPSAMLHSLSMKLFSSIHRIDHNYTLNQMQLSEVIATTKTQQTTSFCLLQVASITN